MAITFVLPELGENIESGTVTAVLVSVGDTVAQEQPVIELETDKAVVEVPSPAAGVITEISVNEGDVLKVGDIVLVVDAAGAAPAGAPPPVEAKAEPEPAPPEPEVEPEPVPEPELASKPKPVPADEPAATPVAPPPAAPAVGEQATKRSVRAAPSARRFAREIGIDIAEVTTTRPSGRVTIDDVKAFAKAERVQRKTAPAPAAAGQLAIPLPDFTKFGKVEREPMNNVRLATSRRMAAAWATIPHVTQHDKADVTALDDFRKQYGSRALQEGGKLTPTAILVKVLAAALKEFPEFNVSVDVEKNEIVRKRYYNIGVAVDTERGLLVPVLKNVDKKSIIEISVELTEMAERARTRKTGLDELQGACISITNLGGIGGTAFTPIVNPPEVAILGVSRSSVEPVYKDGEFVPRTIMPLSMSYDHRVIDGANAARFLRWVCMAVEQPFLLLLD